MLKKEITFEDFNGEKTTETVYFNLTKSEMIEMEVGYEGGLDAAIKRIIEANDRQALIKEFKKILLTAYGVKSEDGKRFVKNDALREDFAQTAAYDALFIQFATDAEQAAAFMKGVLPKDMQAEVARLENETPKLPAPTVPSQ